MSSTDSRGQTGIEAIMIAAIIISTIAIVGGYFFGNSSDATIAIIILKTDLLKEMGTLSQNYVIDHSLEPTLAADGTACFNVVVSPAFSNPDRAALAAKLPAMEQKIIQKTRLKNTVIKLEDDSCP